MTHYDTLGAAPTDDPAALRRAYLKRARALHPDQFVDRPTAERAKAERRMQDVNAAWAVLSDPEERRRYDMSLLRGGVRATGPVSNGPRARTTPTYETPRPKKRAPQVATEEEMELSGFARLVRPGPLLGMVAALIVLVVVVALVSGGGNDDVDRPAVVAEPTGTPLGCIELNPRAIEVPCGNHDAVVWDIIEAGEACDDGLDAVYREGLGGLFCIREVG